MGGGDHRCEWREKAESLELRLTAAAATIAEQTSIIERQGAVIAQQSEALTRQTEQLSANQGTVEKLQRHVFGQRSEKMPPVAQANADSAIRESSSTPRSKAPE